MLAPVLVTPPTDLPITLEEAKLHLRVSHDEEDGLIENLIRAATQHVDGWTGVLGRAVMPQTWRQDFDGWSCLRLLLNPVREIESVTYRDSDGNQQTLDPAVYTLRVDDGGAYVDLAPGQSWPAVASSVDAVSVTYEAGYDEAPAPIRQAMLLLIGHWYDNRQATIVGTNATEVPLAVGALLSPYRRVV